MSLNRKLRGLRLALTAGLAFCLCTAVTVAAQQDRARPPAGQAQSAEAQDLPSAEEVLKKYIEVTGGEEAYKGLKSRHTTIRMSLPGMGVEGTREHYVQVPDKALIVEEYAGLGTVTSGLNGKIGWQTDQMMGSRLLEGDQLNFMILETNLASMAKPHELYQKVSIKGIENVDGEQAYRLSLLPRGSPNAVDAWYSVDSGLLLRNAYVVEGPQGEVAIEARMDDYRDAEGEPKIKLAHRITATAAGMKVEMTIAKAEVNVEIPAEKFELPADIQQLVDQQKVPEDKPEGEGM